MNGESYIFHEFLEILVRVAHYKYGTSSSSSSSSSLSSSLSLFFKNDLVSSCAELERFDLADYTIDCTVSVTPNRDCGDAEKLSQFVGELFMEFHEKMGGKVYDLYNRRAIRRKKR